MTTTFKPGDLLFMTEYGFDHTRAAADHVVKTERGGSGVLTTYNKGFTKQIISSKTPLLVLKISQQIIPATSRGPYLETLLAVLCEDKVQKLRIATFGDSVHGIKNPKEYELKMCFYVNEKPGEE